MHLCMQNPLKSSTVLSDSDHAILQNDFHNFFSVDSSYNKLPLNLSKCSVMRMTHSKSPNHCDTYIMGDSRLDKFKLFGDTCIFRKDLSSDPHTDVISLSTVLVFWPLNKRIIWIG